MIIFNITCHIERSEESAFFEYFKTEYILFLRNNPWLNKIDLYKLATKIDDNTVTYSIKLSFPSRINFQQFQIEDEFLYLQKLQRKFEGKIFTFCTELLKVEIN